MTTIEMMNTGSAKTADTSRRCRYLASSDEMLACMSAVSPPASGRDEAPAPLWETGEHVYLQGVINRANVNEDTGTAP